MTRLTTEQRTTALEAIHYRTGEFQRAELLKKLRAADIMYHMGQKKEDGPDGTNQKDSYSRFSECDIGVVREAVEAYYSYFVSVFLGNSKIFSMTSTADQKDRATEFNTVMGDQQRQTGWEANLTMMLLDAAKYNLAATDTSWITKSYNKITFERDSSGGTPKTNVVNWTGNEIKRIDPYNVLFDQTVLPNEVATKGEWSGYVERLTQVELFRLVQELKAVPTTTVYDVAPKSNPDWTIYAVQGLEGNTNGYNLQFEEPGVEPLSSEGTMTRDRSGTNWSTHFSVASKGKQISQHYNITRMYLRLVPSAYDFPKGTGSEGVELWEFIVLNATHVLATTRMTAAHGLLPIDIAQTDSDSLGLNTAGPAQATMPYQKTAKQMLDRTLAGADRGIRDRAMFDPNYINKDDVNSAIPDAKIPLKKALTGGRTIASVYQSIPFSYDSTGLSNDMRQILELSRQANGINQAAAGQFVKGNRTLEEYNDIQANAGSKQFLRALVLESTFFASIKKKIKMNILQYQQDATIFDPDEERKVEVDRSKLFEASLEFKVADGLKPTEYMLSPNVQQQLLQFLGMVPELGQAYDVMGMVSHILEQSSGVNLEQYKRKEQGNATP